MATVYFGDRDHPPTGDPRHQPWLPHAPCWLKLALQPLCSGPSPGQPRLAFLESGWLQGCSRASRTQASRRSPGSPAVRFVGGRWPGALCAAQAPPGLRAILLPQPAPVTGACTTPAVCSLNSIPAAHGVQAHAGMGARLGECSRLARGSVTRLPRGLRSSPSPRDHPAPPPRRVNADLRSDLSCLSFPRCPAPKRQVLRRPAASGDLNS